ncbi:MAG: bifunctional 3,4-dihydroxy-2-butanone-4-phosphate synthase/GTP cyclohydrolase II [Spirochaetia bacterium]|nr:bifunctional 3,4-dihydroxy-2-butanone-4-phosphate synthase/GTP cyclohydrolase II [Spirochaetota bacterium]MDW8113128.1 bifunctional 3,4-dihydroxy-2-butanone-4-phosphate synthase/GTP cyclohydrolase II [Spirochaetia bacterium]
MSNGYVDLTFNTIEEAISDLRNGKLIIVVDDEKRENEGDFVGAGQFATPEMINFLMKEGRGLICVPMDPKLADKLNLYLMTDENTDTFSTWFTISVDAKEGTTTGISAYDRSTTIRKLASIDARPEDFNKPGHVFPLKARKGGVITRQGHTEATVDLLKIAGLYPVGVICEITNEDGTMARRPQLFEIAKKFNLKIISISQIVKYRWMNERLVERIDDAFLPTKYGNFKIIGYQELISGKEHVAIVKGDVRNKENVIVRIHSECFTGDILGSLRCDCGNQLAFALQTMEEEGEGVLIYLRQEGRGIGLLNKIKTYKLQDQGYDTVEANRKLGFPDDAREYGVAYQILKDLGVKSIRLMTNNPSKIRKIEEYGIIVNERIPIVVGINKYNEKYIRVKVEKMGHLIDLF